MSNEYTAAVATSRRAFIQRTGIAAVATAGAASVLLGSARIRLRMYADSALVKTRTVRQTDRYVSPD